MLQLNHSFFADSPDFDLGNLTEHLGNKTEQNLRSKNVMELVRNLSFIVGIFGNLAALYILHTEKTRYKNKKHVLLLRCMASNDLVALIGMLILTHVPPKTHLRCIWIVIWRVFGMSSGCVAFVMAVERWLALTNPFLYQKKVTVSALMKAVFLTWAVALIITSMPLLGFGTYYDPSQPNACKMHREATEPVDVAYTFVYFTFGLLLCFGISTANLSVTRFLCSSGQQKTGKRECVGRRICRTQVRSESERSCMRVEYLNSSTPEEVSFARLMVALSITFLICWMPLLSTIPLEQIFRSETLRKRLFPVANILMLAHFTLDPIVYVLCHHYFPCLRITFDAVHRHCCCWGHRPVHEVEDTSCTI